MSNLLDQYRPRTLADIAGQSGPVAQLRAFAANPSPKAMLLTGPSGTGKSCAALALATALGIDLEDEFFGGFSQIDSGDQNKESVKKAVADLRYCPRNATGWRLLLVNEADFMTKEAAKTWFDILEYGGLPPRCVVVFTTNEPQSLDGRLRDRCERVEFTGDAIARLIAAAPDSYRANCDTLRFLEHPAVHDVFRTDLAMYAKLSETIAAARAAIARAEEGAS